MMKKFSKYDSRLVGSLFHARTDLAMFEGSQAGLPDFSQDQLKTMLLLVDPQVGFIHDGRPLCVPGAIDDTRRTIEWIYRNLDRLTYIAASLDTHLPFQIFNPSWFCYADGTPVKPFTPIKVEDLNKTVFPIFDFEYTYAPGKKMMWSEYYLTQLAKNTGTFTKKDLMIWPYHCGLGTLEHAIEPSLLEAIYFHAAARFSQPYFLIKGNVPETENYSILEPEVIYSGHQNSGLKKELLDILERYDLIYIAGQAKSHCVYETIVSIVKYFGANAPQVLSRIRILEDCMSAVGGFEDFADQAFAQLVNDYNLKLVKSTDPIR